MLQNNCPSVDLLQEYVAGKLDPARVLEIEEHLLHCPACSQNADTLSPEDDITIAFVATSYNAAEHAQWGEVIELAQQIATDNQTAAGNETIAISSEDTSRIDTSGFREAERVELDFLSPAERDDEIGRLGDYRVQAVLGSGGMGLVLSAEDPILKRSIALKVMKPSAAKSRNARERFLREAQAAATIEHDHVISIYQVGEDRGVPFIAMPMLKGESLRTLLDRERKLEQDEVIRIGTQIADGLAAAHQNGLIHRDIKPDNIWIEAGTGRVKVLDFGLARMTEDDINLTHSGTVLGTPRYMAPEQAAGEVVDHRADLFSLGSVLYHLASGKAPFGGKNLTATLIAVAQADAKPIGELMPNLHPNFVGLIDKLLQREKAARPQTAAEVVADLRAIGTTGTPTSEPSQTGSNRDKHWSRRWGLVVIGVLTTVLAAAYIMRPDTEIAATTNVPNLERLEQQNPALEQASMDSPVKEQPGMEPTMALQLRRRDEVFVALDDIEPLNTVTIELWVFATTAPPEGRADQSLINLQGNHQLKLETTSDLGITGPRWEYKVKLEPKSRSVRPAEPIELGRWTHVACVRDGKIVRMFLDGELISSNEREGPLEKDERNLRIGCSDIDEDYGGFIGFVREIHVSSVPRYKKSFTPKHRLEPDDDTIVLYHCDADTGSKLKDVSHNRRDGAIMGATWAEFASP